MKKVYADIRAILILGPACSFLFYMYIEKEASLYLFIGCFFFFLNALFFYFIPLWSYDVRGFNCNLLKRNEYSWKDVNRISSLKFSNFVVVLTKDNFMLILTTSFTGHYFEVLADVVKFVQKNNPHAIISPFVLKKLKNPPKFYIL
jgi:hypothetical protein